MRPEVSVIVPSYNYGHFLGETLDSVKIQTFQNWECLIVDDGSTDNTKDIAETFISADNRFKYFYQKNRGLSAARNTGLRHSTGDYIQLLDADDLIERDKFACQLNCFEDHPEADIVYGEARFFSDGKPGELRYSALEDDQPWMPKVSGTGQEILKALLTTNIMVVSSPLVRKDVFQTCGLFDESLNNHEDWEFWLRCAQKGKFFQFLDSPKTFTLIRFHPKSMSRNRIKMLETNLRIREKLFPILLDKQLLKSNKNGYNRVGYELAIENIKAMNKTKGFSQLIKYSFNFGHLKNFLYGIKLILIGKGS